MNKLLLSLITAATPPEPALTQKLRDFYTNKPVLVTGGCGFIGSHIVEQLVEYGAHVTIIDDLSSGSLTNIENIKHKITFIKKSIVDLPTCLDVTQGQSIIFHLAAFVSVPQSVEQPQRCFDINVQGTCNLLEAARINKVSRFIFSSSSAVYGEHHGPCSEETPCNPQSPYGFSKLIGELYCKAYAGNFGITTVMLRYFNVYGPRQDPYHPYAAVVAKFIHALNNNEPLIIFGNGKQTRDFIAVNSVAEANLVVGMVPHHIVYGQVFNIASGQSISVLDLATKLKTHFPTYTKGIIFKEPRPGDVQHTQALCNKYQITRQIAHI